MAADIKVFAILGHRVAVLTSDADGGTAIAVADLDERERLVQFRQICQLISPPKDIRLGEVREIAWTAPDGVMSRGAVFLPPNYEQGTRYPIIVNLHGGLRGATLSPGITGGALLYTTPLEFHMWSARGYVVFLPEFRTSGALGIGPLKRMVAERDSYGFHGDQLDILSGIDFLIASGLADPDRVAVMGFSGGAAETNWLIARTHNRFRAAVSCDGFAETYLLLAVGAAVGGVKEFAKMLGGWPWEIPDVYLDNSAIYCARGATTPTLFLMGATEISGVDPTMSSQFMYTALKRQGVETRYIRYAKEGHGLRRPANLRDSVRRAVEWVDKHMARYSSEGQGRPDSNVRSLK